MQGRSLLLAQHLTSFTAPHFVLGILTFVVGLAINWHSDAVLLNLRRPGGEAGGI